MKKADLRWYLRLGDGTERCLNNQSLDNMGLIPKSIRVLKYSTIQTESDFALNLFSLVGLHEIQNSDITPAIMNAQVRDLNAMHLQSTIRGPRMRHPIGLNLATITQRLTIKRGPNDNPVVEKLIYYDPEVEKHKEQHTKYDSDYNAMAPEEPEPSGERNSQESVSSPVATSNIAARMGGSVTGRTRHRVPKHTPLYPT